MRIRLGTRRLAGLTAIVVVAASIQFVAPARAADDVVVTIDCGDVGALIGAMADAAPNTIIQLNADGQDACSYTLTSPFAGSTGLPPVDTGLTIDGNGSTIVRVSATPFRIVEVAAPGSLSLVSVTIAGGGPPRWHPDGDGGGIHNSGALTLVDSTVSGNAGGAGGGIYNSGALTLVDSTVSGNTSSREGGGIASGGGPTHSQATLTLVDSTVSGNTSAGNGGGGIWSSGSATLTDSIVSDNITGGSGGGIESPFADSTLALVNSTVSGNTSVDNTWVRGQGGGIASGGALTLTASTVSGNTSAFGGGGILSVGTATLTDSIVSGNTSSQGGGIYYSSTISRLPCVPEFVIGGGLCPPQVPPIPRGVLTLVGGSVINNHATIHGGGIYSGGQGAAAAVVFAANTPNNCYPSGSVTGCAG